MPHTQLQLAGNAVGPAEPQTVNGRSVHAFRLIAAPRIWNGEEWLEQATVHYACTTRGTLTEDATEQVTDGMPMTVTGRLLRVENSLLHLEADAFGPALGARMPDTHIQFAATAVGEPEVRFVEGHPAFTRFRMRSTPRLWTCEGWAEQPPVHFVCTARGKLAENAADCVVDGLEVTVNGRLGYINGDVLYIEADALGVNLCAAIAYTQASCPPALQPVPAAAAAHTGAGQRASAPAAARVPDDGSAPSWWSRERARGWGAPAARSAVPV